MKFLIIFIVFLELFLESIEIDAESGVGCPTSLPYSSTQRSFRGICYNFIPTEKKWADARDYCRKFNGQLVKITNADVNEFLKGVLNSLWWKNNGIWIGLNDVDEDNEFVWASRSPRQRGEKLGSWSNWGRGHPGAIFSTHRDCIRMVRGDGSWLWHETPCGLSGFTYRFICQYEALNISFTSTTLSIARFKEMTTLPPTQLPVLHSPSTLQAHHASVPSNIVDVHDMEPYAVSMFQGGDVSALEDANRSDEKESKVVPVAIMCLVCLVVLVLVGALFVLRRRCRHDISDVEKVENKYLEATPTSKSENIYIDEDMQKFLKSKESNKEENLYEEIPYELSKSGDVDG